MANDETMPSIYWGLAIAFDHMEKKNETLGLLSKEHTNVSLALASLDVLLRAIEDRTSGKPEYSVDLNMLVDEDIELSEPPSGDEEG